MASRSENERNLAGVVGAALGRWLRRTREAVMRPWREHRMSPDATAVYQSQGAWDSEVESIMTVIGRISQDAWSEASDVSPVSRHAFVMTQLAVTENFLVRIPDEVYNLVFAEMVDGTNAGESLGQLAARIDRVLSFSGSERWPARARTIAQTETTRAYGAGTVAAGMEQARLSGRVLQKRWDTQSDERVRGPHREVDGDVIPLMMPWYVEGFPMMYPGDPSAPPELVINCVPGSALIDAVDIVKVYRFKWTGSTFTFLRKGGAEFTVSPQHPVLTELGWLPASEVKVGCHILRASRANGLSGPGPHVEGPPSTAEEIYRSASLSGERHWVGELSVDFYGDRPSGKVEVVLPDRELSFCGDPDFKKELAELFFSCSDASNASESLQFKLPRRRASAPGSTVRFENLISSLLGSHPAPFDRFSLALGTEGHPALSQTEIDSAPRDPQTGRNGIHGLALEVAMDEIVDVNENPFSGHLYTFETRSGMYLADQIVSHNCRCDVVVLNERGR